MGKKKEEEEALKRLCGLSAVDRSFVMDLATRVEKPKDAVVPKDADVSVQQTVVALKIFEESKK